MAGLSVLSMMAVAACAESYERAPTPPNVPLYMQRTQTESTVTYTNDSNQDDSTHSATNSVGTPPAWLPTAYRWIQYIPLDRLAPPSEVEVAAPIEAASAVEVHSETRQLT